MSAALTDNNPLDGSTTLVAGLITPLVDLKLILEISPLINPIDAGTVGFNSSL
jgi:hypothetical protein